MSAGIGYGEIPRAIEGAISSAGPMTSPELAQYTGIDQRAVAVAVGRMRRPDEKRGGAIRLHVCGWAFDCEGRRRYPRAIYALGPGRDAPRPKGESVARKAVTRDAMFKRVKAASVFNMGMTRAEVRDLVRSTRGVAA